MKGVVIALVCVVAILGARALDNGLAKTPQMGWNSWNHFHCDVNETVIKRTADAIVSLGLDKLGYNYVNVDDCWAVSRDAKGVIQADPKTFPSGIKALADYVHSKGLLFGIYTDEGTKTCAGRPGSLGYEKIDAKTYAEWGVDYVKVDNCNSDTPPEKRYPVMRDALNVSGRLIFFSMCEWGVDNPATWAPKVGNSWRTTGDIRDTWDSMRSNIHNNDAWWQYAGPGGWNDPDMLEVGNGGMTLPEYYTHFSLWSLAKAPLLLGANMQALSNDYLAILKAAEVIAVNQDKLGFQGYKIADATSSDPTEVWSGPLLDGSIAVVLVNTGTTTANVSVNWSDISIKSGTAMAVRNIWQEKDVGTFTNSFSTEVAAHGSFMGIFKPAATHMLSGSARFSRTVYSDELVDAVLQHAARHRIDL